jgi:AcrR family transcriptional regulator/DNA-binding MarR family transcriptional regulator
MSARVNGSRASLAQTKRQGAHVGEMQRRRLLLAISELLAEGGVEAATVGSISRRAGVSRRTFYEVFADREACFMAAFDQAVERIAQDVVPAYAGERTWSARIRAGLLALLEQLDEHPGLARMCVIETLRAGPEVLERRKRVLGILTDAVDDGRAACKPGSEPLPLTAEGVVGGALSVVHARLLEGSDRPLVELANPLTGMILHPYLGPLAARRELDRPPPKTPAMVADALKDPFKGLSIRFTYRTARVLATIATEGGRGSYPSNRLIADSSGIGDEGQMSRLLRRLEGAGLIENRGEGHARGEPNAWRLTQHGKAIHAALSGTEKVGDGRSAQAASLTGSNASTSASTS